MARYLGPKVKISRRFGEPVFGYHKGLRKKTRGPGKVLRLRKKRSEYSIQLQEKQKARYIYGVLERQFSNLFDKAHRRPGVTGENLLVLLESRLDNTIFRLGVAPTRRAARQLVSHRHIVVNGRVVNIPSYSLREQDLIEVRTRSKSLEVIRENLHKSSTPSAKYPWLEWDGEAMTGRFLYYPSRSEIPETIKEQVIVELYSK